MSKGYLGTRYWVAPISNELEAALGGKISKDLESALDTQVDEMVRAAVLEYVKSGFFTASGSTLTYHIADPLDGHVKVADLKDVLRWDIEDCMHNGVPRKRGEDTSDYMIEGRLREMSTALAEIQNEIRAILSV
tara:strand:- start:1125 stop:1526 length:402 start_codon:yes stop_codon:yes gene_type:complete